MIEVYYSCQVAIVDAQAMEWVYIGGTGGVGNGSISRAFPRLSLYFVNFEDCFGVFYGGYVFGTTSC
ncbi:MAG: hypothetical protein LAP87_12020 [Acidobacteriia bacterium]|nr:hypothetical protein [Terriglobia bacterium]